VTGVNTLYVHPNSAETNAAGFAEFDTTRVGRDI
jgi:hypothetical protein